MTADLSPAERRRAIFALALSPCEDAKATAARVAELAPDVPDPLAAWVQLCLAFDRTGTDIERIVTAAAAAGAILDRLVPLPAAPGFTVTVDPATMPLYLGRAAR